MSRGSWRLARLFEPFVANSALATQQKDAFPRRWIRVCVINSSVFSDEPKIDRAC
jgi:hypothetical protein